MKRFASLLVVLILAMSSSFAKAGGAVDHVVFEDPYTTSGTDVNSDYATRQTSNIRSPYSLSLDTTAMISGNQLQLSGGGSSSGVAMLDTSFSSDAIGSIVCLSVDLNSADGQESDLLWADNATVADPTEAIVAVQILTNSTTYDWHLYYGGFEYYSGSNVPAGTVSLLLNEITNNIALMIGGTTVQTLNNAIDGVYFSTYGSDRYVAVGTSATGTAIFDNLTVAVPEPASLATLVVAGAGMLIRRRRA